MFFCSLLCASAFFVFIGLFAIMLRVNPHGRWRNPRRRLWTYVGLAALLSLALLAVFLVLSENAGLITFGTAVQISFPGDYLAAGTTGYLLLGLLAVALLAPIVVALILVRPDRKPKY